MVASCCIDVNRSPICSAADAWAVCLSYSPVLVGTSVITAVKIKDKPKTNQVRPKVRQPAKIPTKPMKPAKATIVPTQGPRLRVKTIPASWTARTRDHKLAFTQNPAVLIESAKVATATDRDNAMVINITEAANIGLPWVDHIREELAGARRKKSWS